LDMVGLAGFESFYPQKLSGGMRQRVAICRALICYPRLLLMDEPFGAVDALTRERLQSDLLRLTSAQQTTTIFVTHSIDEAVMLSDRILVMSPRPGTFVADIDIDIPRPRDSHVRSTAKFHEHVDEVRRLFD